MLDHELPESLQERISEYLETQWDKNGLVVGEKDPVAWSHTLSEPLRQEVLLFLYRDLITSVQMFRNTRGDVILQILNALSTESFLPGEYISKANTVATSMFFIRDGTANVVLDLPAEEQRVMMDMWRRKRKATRRRWKRGIAITGTLVRMTGDPRPSTGFFGGRKRHRSSASASALLPSVFSRPSESRASSADRSSGREGPSTPSKTTTNTEVSMSEVLEMADSAADSHAGAGLEHSESHGQLDPGAGKGKFSSDSSS